MEIEFKPIDGKSVQYSVTIAVLSVLVIGGFYATFQMAEEGVYLSGMNNRVPWGLQIVMAIFYIGLSAGSLVISGLYGILGKLEYKPFARVAAYLAMLFLIGGLLSIITDQGRVDRVFKEPFLHCNPRSMFSINPALYFGYIAICILYLWTLINEKHAMTKVSAILVVTWAIGTHTGTGFIFALVPREFYSSSLLPVGFVVAALSSGTAVMIIVIVSLFKLTKRPLEERRVIWLGRLLAVFILLTMYTILIENFHRYYLFETRKAAFYYMFGGFHGVLLWGGLMLTGNILPALLLFDRNRGKSIPWIVFSSVLVVFGVFCERYLIVIPGLTYPPNLFQGMIVRGTVLSEGIATYNISFFEVLQAMGVMGFIGLAFILGLKKLYLLPTEAKG